jgi:NADH-quinone oxidoreductase subunit N
MTGMNDLLAIAPFVCAVAGAVVIALLDAISPPQGSRRFLGSVALVFLGLMALAAFSDFGRGPWGAFYGMVVADGVGRLFTVIFVSAAALAVLAAMGRLGDGADGNSIRGEFYALLLISTGGATLLGQAADLVVLFLALETLSIPAYVLAAGRRSDALSAEAGMKYFILGAVASGLLLYGIALLYGASGSTSFSQLARAVQERSWSENFLFIAGAVLVVAGLLFKLAAAPLHMWAPDVYQGSPTPATVFFSTGIKAAAFLALLRGAVSGAGAAAGGGGGPGTGRLVYLATGLCHRHHDRGQHHRPGAKGRKTLARLLLGGPCRLSFGGPALPA